MTLYQTQGWPTGKGQSLTKTTTNPELGWDSLSAYAYNYVVSHVPYLDELLPVWMTAYLVALADTAESQ